jgi:nitroreductase
MSMNTKPEPEFVPLPADEPIAVDEMRDRVTAFCQQMEQRRSVRQFSTRPVPRDVIEAAVRAAHCAPSGANMQPWHFVVVGDPTMKRKIREAAEAQERAFYEKRASGEWLGALSKIGTGPEKSFLEEAPYLIVVFAQRYGLTESGERVQHYYVNESVGIATGVLITALHQAGLGVLTYTPSPMRFLHELLERPENERPFLVLVTGYPAEDAVVPTLEKKPLSEVVTFLTGDASTFE